MNDFKRGMKRKTIKAVLTKKFNAFTASIEDEKVRALVEKNSIITGGCIASMLLGDPINDFDLYFTNKETASAVAHYYVKRFQIKKKSGIDCAIGVDTSGDRVKIVVRSAGVASEEGAEAPYEYFEGQSEGEAGGYVSEVMSEAGEIEDTYQETEQMALEVEDDDYRPVFLSTNAITLSGRVQLILRFFGDAEELHKNYDFVHATNYWLSKNGEITLRPEALESLMSRELRYVGSRYPICSVIRLRKFIKRGWVINAGQILKMMLQVSELDLSDPLVLQEQLTGVDSAYFIEVMSKLKERDPERVDAAYLVEIIDRMF